MSADNALALGNFGARAWVSAVGGRQLHPQVTVQASHRQHATPPGLVESRCTGTGEQRTGVIPSQQGRGQIENVAVHQPARWKSWATVAPPSTSSCTIPRLAQFVEDGHRVAVQLEGGPHRRIGGRPAQHHPQRLIGLGPGVGIIRRGAAR